MLTAIVVLSIVADYIAKVTPRYHGVVAIVAALLIDVLGCCCIIAFYIGTQH